MNRVTSIKGVAAEKGVRQLSSHWSLYAMFTFNGSGGRNRYTFEEVMVQGGVENVYLGLLSHDLSSLHNFTLDFTAAIHIRLASSALS